MPFRFGVNGANAAVVQQDTQADVRNCVELVLRTEVGSRLHVPGFGIDDPTFSVQPVSTTALEQAVVENEPRAVTTFESVVDLVTETMADITVGVSSNV